jgi:hypothetical protein
LHLRKSRKGDARRNGKVRERKAAVAANISLGDDVKNAAAFFTLLSFAFGRDSAPLVGGIDEPLITWLFKYAKASHSIMLIIQLTTVHHFPQVGGSPQLRIILIWHRRGLAKEGEKWGCLTELKKQKSGIYWERDG